MLYMINIRKVKLDMKYKESMYNYVKNHNESLILFNSYSRIIAKSQRNTEIIKKLLEEPNDIEAGYEDLHGRLVEDGFLVPEFEDEITKADLLHMDVVNDSTLNLIFLGTEQCNFRCKYCYESFERGSMLEEVQEGVVNFVNRNIGNYKKLAIDWFGGEPLEAFDVIENLSEQLIPICQKRGKIYESSITTNGYNLTLDKFRRLLKYRVRNFQITLDGPQACHDNTRVLADGGETFNTIINNLRAIRDNIKSYTFTISVRTNVTKDVYEKLDEHIEMLYNEFHNDLRFMFYFRPVGDWGGERVKTLHGDMVGADGFSHVYRKVMESKYQLNCYMYYRLLADFGTMCTASRRNNYIIGSDGTIYKCTMLFDKEENQLGKIHRDGKFEVSQDKHAKWVTGVQNIKDSCKKCFFRPQCNMSSCPAGKFLIQADQCGYEKRSIDSILALLTNDVLLNNNFRNIKRY